MKTSVYITSGHIEAIAYSGKPGRLKIVDYLSEPLPERTMINGNITDMTALSEKLSALKAKKPRLFRNICLTIDSNLLAVKDIPVPRLKKKQYFQIIKDEFVNNLNGNEDALIDYTVTRGPDKQTVLFALCSSRSFIASYIQVFKEAGISLKFIGVGLEAVSGYIKTRHELSDKTFILNIVDGVSMLSIIFCNGNNVFSTRIRLAGEDDESRLQSIANNLSPLIQFAKSQKLPDIYKSYYLGLTNEQARRLGGVGDNLAVFNLFFNIKNAQIIKDPCHLSFMGIYNKGIDLLLSYKNAQKNMRDYKPVSRLWIIPALLTAALVAAYIIPVRMTNLLDTEISELNAYLSDENVMSKLEEISEITQEAAVLSFRAGQISGAIEEAEAMPVMTGELMDLIARSHPGVVIDSFEMNANGTVWVSGSSDTQLDSSQYAERLLSDNRVDSVEYTGYKFDNLNRFRFTILVSLHSETE